MRDSVVWVIALLVVGAFGASGPAEAREPRWRAALSFWNSDGRTDLNLDASGANPLLGNPTSELVYSGAGSRIVELSADLRLPHRFVLRGSYGRGDQDSGKLIDDDFLSAEGARAFGATVSGEHMFSRTVSDIDADDLEYFSVELARPILRPRESGATLSAVVGYRNWQERHVATGFTQLTCTAVDVLCSPVGTTGALGEPAITNDAEWQSVWVGLEGSRLLGRSITLHGRLAYAPGAEVAADDTHHLRTDLQQDPSFRSEADGDGTDLEARLEFRVSRRLKLSLGYRRWKIDADDGTVVVFPIDDPPGGAPLNDYRIDRDGVTLSLRFDPLR